VVTVACTCMLTLNRSRTHAPCCATIYVYVVKPKENGYAQGLQLDVMIQLCVAGSDIVYCRF
jgi:hypothetical protein